MKKFATALIILLACLTGANVWACGDSLYRVGKGISYRVYTAPLPGNVLVYGSSEGTEELAKALAESGHMVDVVHSELELSLELENGAYDVVIGSFIDHDTIESTVSSSAAKTTYLPVVANDTEAEVAKRSYDRVMIASRDEIKHYLKAIHKTLKNRA